MDYHDRLKRLYKIEDSLSRHKHDLRTLKPIDVIDLRRNHIVNKQIDTIINLLDHIRSKMMALQDDYRIRKFTIEPRTPTVNIEEVFESTSEESMDNWLEDLLKPLESAELFVFE